MANEKPFTYKHGKPGSLGGDHSDEVTEIELELEPEYHVTTFVDDRLIGKFESPITDPFATTTVQIHWRDVLRAALRRRGLTVRVSIGGNWDAVKHVLTVEGRPMRAAISTEEHVRTAVQDDLTQAQAERRTRPHTVWYWIDSDYERDIPVPFSTTFDSADEAEAEARRLIDSHQRGGIPELGWVKVFLSTNEAYETFRWERPKGTEDVGD